MLAYRQGPLPLSGTESLVVIVTLVPHSRPSIRTEPCQAGQALTMNKSHTTEGGYRGWPMLSLRTSIHTPHKHVSQYPKPTLQHSGPALVPSSNLHAEGLSAPLITLTPSCLLARPADRDPARMCRYALPLSPFPAPATASHGLVDPTRGETLAPPPRALSPPP